MANLRMVLKLLIACYNEFENDSQIGAKMRESYNSARRNAILETIKAYGGAFSARDLFEKMKGEIALATIYRALDTFTDAGLVIKNTDPEGQVFYLYTTECERSGHCFLKCRLCGAVEHVDCGVVSELVRHIYEGHHFLIDDERIVLSGVCGNCNEIGDI
jgi:Fe2+ or Zn2+ uptake regulation protein